MAAKLKHYQNQNCAVIALNSGGVLVAAQIALKLHANLMVLLNNKVMLPGEPDPLATMTSTSFTYNSAYSAGQKDDLVTEYRGTIDAQRQENFHRLNLLLSDGSDIDRKLLRDHTVILVADILANVMLLDVASDFLKPIKIKKLVIAMPLASVDAVDKMHLLGDEIFCLSIGDNLMQANHYYEDNNVPNHRDIIKIINHISLNWQPSLSK